MKVYQRIANLLLSIHNCNERENYAWRDKHGETLEEILDTAPSGSGIDNGSTLLDESTPDKLVFSCDFHHMNSGGFYDGWTEHKVIVTPSLAFGFDIKVTGRDRNDIKSHLAEVFHEWLNQETEV